MINPTPQFEEKMLREYDDKFGSYTEGAYYEKEDTNLGDEMKSFLLSKFHELEEYYAVKCAEHEEQYRESLVKEVEGMIHDLEKSENDIIKKAQYSWMIDVRCVRERIAAITKIIEIIRGK